jgi:hypothetical protein
VSQIQDGQLHVAFMVRFRYGVRPRRQRRKTDGWQEKDERDAVGGRDRSEAGSKVEAFARSRHPGRFAADDEIGGGQVSRRVERGHPDDRRRGTKDHRGHADRRRKEFVVLVARVHFAARFDDRSGAVGSVAVRHDG